MHKYKRDATYFSLRMYWYFVSAVMKFDDILPEFNHNSENIRESLRIAFGSLARPRPPGHRRVSHVGLAEEPDRDLGGFVVNVFF